mgnify:CR=1 FL=1
MFKRSFALRYVSVSHDRPLISSMEDIMNIRDAIKDDAQSIAAIYNHYIANATVTFEEDLVDGFDIAIRLSENAEQKL